MTGKGLLNSIAKGKADILQQFLAILSDTGSGYCVIGGLAVSAYVEPVVSLDIDVVVAVHDIETIANAAKSQQWKVEQFEHSINISDSVSDLRIQIQTDPRYQGFIVGSELRHILGYEMEVASLEDVLKGKVWEYMDETRRRSKRQKDLADILRIIETFPDVAPKLPQSLREHLQVE
jgi:hypothetical protein